MRRKRCNQGSIIDLRAQGSKPFICAGCHRRRRRRVPDFETGVHSYY